MRHTNDDAATSCIVLGMQLHATGSRPWDTAASGSCGLARAGKCGRATCPTTCFGWWHRGPASTHRSRSAMALYLASREQTQHPLAVDLAELLSLRVHAGGPGQPPLVANPAVATTTTSPSPAACNIEDENRCHRNSARPEDVPTMLPNARFLPQCLCDNWPCLGLNRLQPRKQ